MATTWFQQRRFDPGVPGVRDKEQTAERYPNEGSGPQSQLGRLGLKRT